jgi:hypothetical protein
LTVGCQITRQNSSARSYFSLSYGRGGEVEGRC